VGIDCARERVGLAVAATRVRAAGRAPCSTGRDGSDRWSRAPRDHLDRHRARLHQVARELRARHAAKARGRAPLPAADRGATCSRASCARRVAGAETRRGDLRTRAVALDRAEATLSRRRADLLATRAAALRAHDPERALERGYSLVLDGGGEPLASAAAVRTAKSFDLRLADGTVGARVRRERRRNVERSTQDLRGRRRAARGDHRAARLERGRPARDARPLQRGQDPDRVRATELDAVGQGSRSCGWTS